MLESSIETANVLLLDDDRDSGEVLAEILRDEFKEIAFHVFDQPVEAFKAVKRVIFDAVVSDLRMPFMDGHEFARGVRLDSLIKQPLLIAISVSRAAIAKASLDGHFDHVLPKPVNLQALFDLIGRS